VSLHHYWPEHWNGKGGTFIVQQHVDDIAAFIAALGLRAGAFGRAQTLHRVQWRGFAWC
jgi:hypothetical protein